ncbi:MAG: flagellar basal-body rod protein FlgF [Clostridiales bacterium]|nr:flagellar basal-body rod protein FlgF [Clostridiales bacterium]
MLRGLYNATTAMQVETARLNAIANNMANAETTGYKKDKMVSQSFPDVLVARIENKAGASIRPFDIIGSINHGVHVDQVKTDWLQGPLQQTDNVTDLALTGNGFFVLRVGENDYRYTRDGAFAVDGEGYLVNQNGYRVQRYDEQNEFADILVGNERFSVDPAGNVYTDQQQYVGAIAVVDFEDRDGALEKAGYNLYVVYDPEQYQYQFAGAGIKQGYLEVSNVDINKEMTDMMEVYRHYESAQRIVSMLDQTLDKTVNEVGRV